MILEHIVEIYGRSIDKHLISRRVEIQESSTFKGIKTYRIEIWEAGGVSPIISSQDTKQITISNKDDIVESIESDILYKLFNYYESKQ